MSDVIRLLRERAGLDAASFGVPGILYALDKRISASGAESPPDYLRRLSADAGEFQELLEELVVPETWFFRELQAFRYLAGYLDHWRTSRRGSIRVLSVACSTGEEVYSLAITLREAGFSPSDARILGTDISRKSLAAAREGTYSSRSYRGPDEAIRTLRDRWCRAVGESWRVGDELRGGVEFANQNLARPDFLAGESPFHVVFCRNVLIYFHPEARRVAVRHLHRLLMPDGVVFAAPAEARIFSDAGFPSLGSDCPFGFRRPEMLSDERLGNAVRPSATSLLPAPALPVRARPTAGANQRRVAGAVRPSAPAAAETREVASAAALLAAARQAADNGRLEEANVLCDRVLAQDAASAEAHYLRGLVRQAGSHWSEAQRRFRKGSLPAPQTLRGARALDAVGGAAG